MVKKSEVDIARKIYYDTLSWLFVFESNENRFENLEKLLKILQSSPLDDESFYALQELTLALENQKSISYSREYDLIFHAPPRAISNTFSFYDEGYESGNCNLIVKNILGKTDIRKNEKNFKENEDNIGFVFTLMSELTQRKIQGERQYEEYSKEVFEKIINPNIDIFLDNIFLHPSSDIYKNVSILTRTFMEFERLYFQIPKSTEAKRIKAQNGISRSEKLRRDANKLKREFSKAHKGKNDE